MNTHAVADQLTCEEEQFTEALGRVLLVLPRLMDTEMLKAQRLSMSEFMAMLTISRHPGHGVRMTDLARANYVSLSGMTRIVNRLVNEGWVERVKCAEDARGASAALTGAGAERLREAMPVYVAKMRQHIFGHLAPDQLGPLTDAMNAIAPTGQGDRVSCDGDDRTSCDCA
jgi:DNA-binding MarR family transcriptional regulator